ncbi:MT-A70-domain-containing protein [Syncephalis plumigaleata]|nr:MT-A70-domain-containing protein [Syncephalis plumigaleata]
MELLDTRQLYSRGLAGYTFNGRYFELDTPYQRANPKKRQPQLDSTDEYILAAYKQLDRTNLEQITKGSTVSLDVSSDDSSVDKKRKRSSDESDEVDFPAFGHLVELAHNDLSSDTTLSTIQLATLETTMELDQLFYTDINNSSSTMRTIHVNNTNDSFLIPAHTRFLMCDIKACYLLKQVCPPGGYDLIVMDPPFPNTSATRGHQYDTLDLYDLFQLPINDLLAPLSNSSNNLTGGLLCCWITNRPRIRRVLLEKLFPAWGVTLIAEWYWLKITRKGDPILPLGNPHRKPFERLLIARRTTTSTSNTNTTSTIPSQRVFTSIQCTLHSRKPPLDDLLRKYLPMNEQSPPQCLELFARSLTPGWTSWGNEPLKFQSTRYFIPTIDSETSTA